MEKKITFADIYWASPPPKRQFKQLPVKRLPTPMFSEKNLDDYIENVFFKPIGQATPLVHPNLPSIYRTEFW